MIAARDNRTLALAFALSLAMHLAFLLAAPNPAGSAPPAQRRSVVVVRLTSPVPPTATQPDEPETRDIELGLDAPNPPSPTWLGFVEYLKQLAAKGEVEQAAFTDDSVAAAAAVPPALAARPAPLTPPAQPLALLAGNKQPVDTDEAPVAHDIQPTPTPADERSSETEGDPSSDPGSDSADAAQPKLSDGQLALSHAESEPTWTTRDQATGSFLAPINALIERAREAAMQAAALARSHDAASSVPARPVESKPVRARQPASGDSRAGAQSDRESDATSIIEVPREQWQLGKPLAAHGLEIKPRRPEMTILTTLTAWPRNPLCKLSFDRDGVPVRAALVQATGDSRVDAAIEASLYRWRASGTQLESLVDGQTVELTIRLVINPERRSEDKDDPA